MGASVVARVESAMGCRPVSENQVTGGIRIRMLGAFAIFRQEQALSLPPSRKLRALLAYLTLAPHALRREHLCELLWDIPNDPRGELRWCLSKARRLLDEPDRPRIETVGGTVRLDLRDCDVDVAEVGQQMQQDIGKLDSERLRLLLARFNGDFLDGLEIDRSPSFNSWLVAQRRRYRAYRVALLDQLVARLPEGSDESLASLDVWLQHAPFDRRVHELILRALGRRGRVKEGDEHLAATARSYEAEGLDWSPLRDAWREAKAVRALPSVSPIGAEPALPEAGDGPGLQGHGRASIAVMPFTDITVDDKVRGGPADGLVHDIITRLAKLRSLMVIAQGTVFALDQRSIGPDEAGRTLNVHYVVSGSLHRTATRITANVQLIETRSARVIWADVFDHKLDDTFFALDQIGDQIVSAIDVEIESAERSRAILKPPSSLDAWEAHHRGLWHMYRFNRVDNDLARNFFQMAVRLDPTFSRAYAGLSFTHWQSAFQQWGEHDAETDRAYEAASRGLLIDERDPAAHWAMGRALWLRGKQEQSLDELRSAVDLSPNFALGHYTLGFVSCQSGQAEAAIGSADRSRYLSPLDPLLFGMLAVRAIALARLGRFEEAAEWAVKAAGRPNAHVHILAIAAHCLAMADRRDEAMAYVASIRTLRPQYSIDDFLAAFRLSEDVEALFRRAAQRNGLG
ncbi:MAG: transcriptional regulator [Candidimonas sp.]|nr:transcriptional regulator [Candidimonas sp.]